MRGERRKEKKKERRWILFIRHFKKKGEMSRINVMSGWYPSANSIRKRGGLVFVKC